MRERGAYFGTATTQLVVAEGGKTLFGCGRAPAGLAIVDETAERSAALAQRPTTGRDLHFDKL